MTTETNLKVRHIRDRKNKNRVLTLVTRLTKTEEGPLLEYGYAVNSPPRLAIVEDSKDFVVAAKIAGDRFSKKTGRRIAQGRMECERTVRKVRISDTTHPYVAVLDSLAANAEDHAAARIAQNELKAVARRRYVWTQRTA